MTQAPSFLLCLPVGRGGLDELIHTGTLPQASTHLYILDLGGLGKEGPADKLARVPVV